VHLGIGPDEYERLTLRERDAIATEAKKRNTRA